MTEDDDELLRKFREYTAAIVDKETISAAEIYATYSEDETFIKLVNAYHTIVSGFEEGRREGAVSFLKKEICMSDQDIAEIEKQLEGSDSTLIDFAVAMHELNKVIKEKGIEMTTWEMHLMLQSEEFRKRYGKFREEDEE